VRDFINLKPFAAQSAHSLRIQKLLKHEQVALWNDGKTMPLHPNLEHCVHVTSDVGGGAHEPLARHLACARGRSSPVMSWDEQGVLHHQKTEPNQSVRGPGGKLEVKTLRNRNQL